MARFTRMQVYQQIYEQGLVPLFYHPTPETAYHITEALYAGGCRVLEFTNRGDFAIEVFSGLVRRAATDFPEMIIGVGTVSDAPTAALFLAHGANFVVSPTFSAETARLCNSRKVAYLPGCATLTEIAAAEAHGAEIVKLFPGATSGGPAFVKAVKAPRPWTRIMPTGGVSGENLRDWFAAGVACVGMGSQLVRSTDVDAGHFESITEATRAALAEIRDIRAG